MVGSDEAKTAESATEEATPATERGPGDGGTTGEAGASGDTGAAGDTGWPDLAAYCDLLRAEHAAWSERVGAIETQLTALRPALLGIAAQHRQLAIEEDLDQLNRMILGGAAMAQSVRLGFDLERMIALVWPAAADPRPTLAREDGEGEYRVEIFLHVGPDGRGRVRVEGAKRLEAPLPTSRQRLRAVLLGAIQAPKFVGDEGAAAEGDQPATTSAQPSAEAGPEHGPEKTDKEQDEEGPVETATPRPGDPDDQPPPEEQVIPLGPASTPDEDKNEKPKARRRAKA